MNSSNYYHKETNTFEPIQSKRVSAGALLSDFPIIPGIIPMHRDIIDAAWYTVKTQGVRWYYESLNANAPKLSKKDLEKLGKEINFSSYELEKDGFLIRFDMHSFKSGTDSMVLSIKENKEDPVVGGGLGDFFRVTLWDLNGRVKGSVFKDINQTKVRSLVGLS